MLKVFLSVFLAGRGGGSGGGMMPDPTPSQPRRPTLVQTKIDVASPYHGWKLYFPDEGNGRLELDFNESIVFELILLNLLFKP